MIEPIVNTKCLKQACDNLGIKYSILDEFGNWISVHLDRDYHFVNSMSAFNNDSIFYICKDKGFTSSFLSEELKTPKTKSYLDPSCAPAYQKYVKFDSTEKIVEDIQNTFEFPLMIKMNAGFQGQNVFACQDKGEVKEAIEKIYNQNSRHYDKVLIAQEMINIEREFRLIRFRNKTLLAYEKTTDHKLKLDPSPFKNEGSKAVIIDDIQLVESLNNFLDKSKSLKQVEYCGADLVIDDKGDIWLIELNTNAGFNYFVRDNGEEPLVKMYETILKDLILKKND